MGRGTVITAGLSALLCGCTGNSPTDTNTGNMSADRRATDTTDATLAPLSEADLAAARLTGELRCSFARAPNAEALLIAAGDVASTAPAQAVVKVAGTLTHLSASGGFDAIVNGATFTGGGATIRIGITGPPRGGGESPPRPATLSYRYKALSAELPGAWRCGP